MVMVSEETKLRLLDMAFNVIMSNLHASEDDSTLAKFGVQKPKQIDVDEILALYNKLLAAISK